MKKLAKVSYNRRGHAFSCWCGRTHRLGPLAKAGINIQMISTSEIKVSVVIEESKMEEAVQVLHQVFELEKE